ncbi:Uncharacterised protein [Bifidobacterium breve]|nr:Uncharacterised protein [Bifidobacterium breve]
MASEIKESEYWSAGTSGRVQSCWNMLSTGRSVRYAVYRSVNSLLVSKPACFRPLRMEAIGCSLDMEPEPEPPRIGCVEPQPKTFSFLVPLIGRLSSLFCSMVTASLYKSCACVLAAAMVSSLNLYFLAVALPSRVAIGPVSIRAMDTLTTTSTTSHDSECTSLRTLMFCTVFLLTANVMMIAATNTTPSTTRYGVNDLRTAITSDILISSMRSFSYSFCVCAILCQPAASPNDLRLNTFKIGKHRRYHGGYCMSGCGHCMNGRLLSERAQKRRESESQCPVKILRSPRSS